MKYFWFGDSWVAGDELEKNQPAFPEIVSDCKNAECVNLGQCGASIDDIPYEFFQNQYKLKQNDVVFFCLTASHRISLFEDGILKRIVPSEMYQKHRPHSNASQWYKYFDNQQQRSYNRDKTINLLYFWTKQLGIKCWFANIFTIETTSMIDATPDDCWLVPKNDCLASSILPVIDEYNLYMSDHPDITNQQWKLQQSAIDQFIKPNWAHPNAAGHLKIADTILSRLGQ